VKTGLCNTSEIVGVSTFDKVKSSCLCSKLVGSTKSEFFLKLKFIATFEKDHFVTDTVASFHEEFVNNHGVNVPFRACGPALATVFTLQWGLHNV
jgi:hypothetical protein